MKKTLVMLLSLLLVLVAAFGACKGKGDGSSSDTGSSSSDTGSSSPDSSSPGEQTDTYLRSEDYISFYKTDYVKNETVMMKEDETGWIGGSLLFEPVEIISVKNYDLSVTYSPDDYVMEGRDMVRSDNSALPYMRQSIISCENLVGTGLQSLGNLVFTEDQGIVKYLLNVTYRYDPAKSDWSYTQEDVSATLSNVTAKLKAGEDIDLFLFGDSIGAGCHASSVLGYNPYMPIWGKAVANEIEKKYENTVGFYNGSFGGWTSGDGAKNISTSISIVPGDAPDLAIVEFGMNDGSNSVSETAYRGNIDTIVATIRESAPDCDIILISTIRANVLSTQDKALVGKYHAENERIAAKYDNVAVVNMTAMSDELYDRKDGLDLLANNINHPNDFFVRCFAMSILDALGV